MGRACRALTSSPPPVEAGALTSNTSVPFPLIKSAPETNQRRPGLLRIRAERSSFPAVWCRRTRSGTNAGFSSRSSRRSTSLPRLPSTSTACATPSARCRTTRCHTPTSKPGFARKRRAPRAASTGARMDRAGDPGLGRRRGGAVAESGRSALRACSRRLARDADERSAGSARWSRGVARWLDRHGRGVLERIEAERRALRSGNWDVVSRLLRRRSQLW